MEKQNEILKRYYEGKSTVAEERMLRKNFLQGEFPDEPMLACQQKLPELPEGLSEKIQAQLHVRATSQRHYWKIVIGSIAAMLVLLISLRGLITSSRQNELQLSDNLKKERFENALRIIGNVLEEKIPVTQKVLYEDNKLIIAIE